MRDVSHLRRVLMDCSDAMATNKERQLDELYELVTRLAAETLAFARGLAAAGARAEASADAPKEKMTPKEFLATARAEGLLPASPPAGFDVKTTDVVSKSDFVPTMTLDDINPAGVEIKATPHGVDNGVARVTLDVSITIAAMRGADREEFERRFSQALLNAIAPGLPLVRM